MKRKIHSDKRRWPASCCNLCSIRVFRISTSSTFDTRHSLAPSLTSFGAMHFIFGCTANCIHFRIIITHIFFLRLECEFEFRRCRDPTISYVLPIRVYLKFNFLKTSGARRVGNKTKLIAFAMGNAIERWQRQRRRQCQSFRIMFYELLMMQYNSHRTTI